MIYQTVDTKYEFSQAFVEAGRKDQFSSEALDALFDYLDDSEDDYELDVIALCCEWNEMDVKECVEAYNIDISDADDEDEVMDIVEEYLNDETTCIRLSDSFLFIAF